MENRLTRTELVAAANELAQQVLSADQYEPITDPTVRYWLAEGLLPVRGGPKRAARYQPALVHRCVFIRRLQLLESLTLAQIKDVLEQVDPPTIKRVAEGQEKLELANVKPASEIIARKKRGETVINMHQKRKAQPASRKRPDDDRPQKLDAISDAVKIEAIDEALQSVGLEAYTAQLLRLDYGGMGLSMRSGFRCPARLELELCHEGVVDGKGCRDIREVSDVVLFDAIGTCLSARTHESYVVQLGSKNYLKPGQHDQASNVRISILLARDVDA